MSDLGFNKIAGAVLAAGFAITLMNQVSEKVFAPDPKVMEECKNCPEVEAEGSTAVAIVMPPPDWGTVLPAADLKKGETIFEKCKSCHKPTEENGTGPGLLGVEGRKPGTHAGFKYSDPMVAFGATNPQWTFDHLEQFLTKPKNVVPDTKMTFPGLKKQEDRINVIAYLHTLNSTLAVPAPDAARAAATAAALAGGTAPAAAPAAGAEAKAGSVEAGATAAPAAPGAPAASAASPKGPASQSPAAPGASAPRTK